MNGELMEVTETSVSTTSSFELADVDGAKEYMDNYQAVCKAILVPADYQKIKVEGKLRYFKKKSAWRKIALAFNITDEVIEKEIIRDENHQIISATFMVRAIAPNGRTGEATASCSIFDKIRNKETEQPSNFELRKRFSNAENDVIATAHTRAKSRAISDLVGMGEVSAEEMEGMVEANARTAVTVTPKKEVQPKKAVKPKTAPKKETEPKVDDEAIEVEVLSDGKPVKTVKDWVNEDENIKRAVDELQEEQRVVNKPAIKDRLLNMMQSGAISKEAYEKTQEVMG